MAYELDVIFNAPDVFPDISIPGLARIETAGLLENRANIGLIVEGGAFMFAWAGPGLYEVNASFLGPYRGIYAKKAISDAIRWMFLRSTALTLFSRFPANNRRARVMLAQNGARLTAIRRGVWPTETGPVDACVWALNIEDWIRQSDALVLKGVEAFDALQRERERLGGEALPAPPMRPFGAAFGMLYAGQLDKAAVLWNRLATMASLPLMEVVAHDPELVEVYGVLIQIERNGFRAIRLL